MEIHPYISTYGYYKHITRSFQYSTEYKNPYVWLSKIQLYSLWKAEEKKQVTSFTTVVITKKCLKSSQDLLCRLLEWHQIKNKITLKFYRKQTYKKN